MDAIKIECECDCGSQDFELRLKRLEQIGLVTCSRGHHSLLLDSRDYWGDVIQDGRPKRSRCRCGASRFRVTLEYDFRDDYEVRTILIQPKCAACERPQKPVLVDIKYAPTASLIARPLDRIELPWLQPKRHEITSLWRPADAESFAAFLVKDLGARVFTTDKACEFRECELSEIEFYPELKRDLLFTNLFAVSPQAKREPEKSLPFLRLSAPFHMQYALPSTWEDLEADVCLLHYIRYSEQTLRGTELETLPTAFLDFGHEVWNWLTSKYVSLRGRNTADNLDEHLRADRLRFPEKYVK